jgi:hypothetical protein
MKRGFFIISFIWRKAITIIKGIKGDGKKPPRLMPVVIQMYCSEVGNAIENESFS